MSEHVAVLGSNSFSGAHFIAHLLDAGYHVLGISRSPQPHPVFLPYARHGAVKERFRFLQADLNHDLDAIMERLGSVRPAYVVNFAAQGMVAESWEHPDQWLMTNTVSPVRLHERLRHCSWLRKFVQISTPEVYGSTTGRIKESVRYAPSTPYAVSKAATDMHLMCYCNAYGFPVVFTRAANVFGPCQRLYRIVPRTVLRFLSGGKLELHGGGVSRRSFIHIADVAEATRRIMEEAEPGAIYHISTEPLVSIRDLVERIAGMMGVDPRAHVVSTGERLGKDQAYSLDCSRLSADLGWQPRRTLEEGIEEVIRWASDNLPLLRTMPQEYEHKA